MKLVFAIRAQQALEEIQQGLEAFTDMGKLNSLAERYD